MGSALVLKDNKLIHTIHSSILNYYTVSVHKNAKKSTEPISILLDLSLGQECTYSVKLNQLFIIVKLLFDYNQYNFVIALNI